MFRRADFRKVNLDGAKLQGASFDHAQLQGASLADAQLQGASFYLAQLQGANVRDASLQGAWLNHAQLQGASFADAGMQDVWLEKADLQGVSLARAQLQGADFEGSTLASTDMSKAAVWRTSFENAALTDILADGLEESAISKDDFAKLKAIIMKEPKFIFLDAPENRIKILNPDIFGPETNEQDTLEKGRVDQSAYESALAAQLKSLACSGDESDLYIVRGLYANNRIKSTGAQAPGLVEAILDPKCPVSTALTGADKARLKKLARDMRPSESKQ